MYDIQRQRLIRSFVRREGRLTISQQRAIEKLWERFGIDPVPGPLDLDSLFGRQAPRILEIGFGDGESLVTMANAYPKADYMGIEVHRPGIGHLFLQAQALDLTNLRVLCMDAVEVLEQHLADTCLDRIQIFFPDPWPKKRHHKRRLIQPAFIELAVRKLKSDALLHLATDWKDYALHMQTVLETCKELVNTAGQGHFTPRPEYRPLTKFEQRGQRLGHDVWDLIFRKKTNT